MPTAKRAICTIIAKNYVAAARTLCNSFLQFHPDLKCYVLIVDDYEDFINPQAESFQVVSLADLNLPDLPSLCFKYNVVELCTAVKAELLAYLLREEKVDQLFYLDPDILVTHSLDDIFARLDTFDALLTPHVDQNFPEDGLYPNDGTILRYGIYNLGFIGVTPRADSLLRWWQSKLVDLCIDDPIKGYFVDQKFMNLAPLYFDRVGIEDSPGCNVAFWNLHSRRIQRAEHGWLCNDSPLYFYHFSNFDPQHPESISGYQTRHQLTDRPDVQPLFREYTRLLFQNGYEQTRRWPYTYNTFSTGEPIPYGLRVLYRNSPDKWKRWGDPFDSTALKRLARWVEMKGKGTYFFNAVASRYRRWTQRAAL
ncbi:MAG TPA: hypothetical protein VJT50_14040 [Pyrinomonadaceae bacterium]|nr:hypothetical protein [Pyrinomonadaceae bacterium]